jgi:hypothetical protein
MIQANGSPRTRRATNSSIGPAPSLDALRSALASSWGATQPPSTSAWRTRIRCSVVASLYGGKGHPVRVYRFTFFLACYECRHSNWYGFVAAMTRNVTVDENDLLAEQYEANRTRGERYP